MAPAHHWNISDEALDHIIALVDLTAKKMAKGAHTVAEFDGRKTIMSSDVRLARSLGEGQ